MAVDIGYKVERQFPGIETLGSAGTRNVTIVGITTHGHEVYLEFRIPEKDYSAAQVKAYATGYTGTVENVFSVPGVVGEQWYQDVTPSNQLGDFMLITVQSDSGDSTAQFSVPFAKLDPAFISATASKLVAEMNAAEAGS